MSETLPKMDPKDINWSSLGFGYMPTNSYVRTTWQDGKWSEPVLIKEPTITMSIAATCLHYGQAAFEGLKAFRQKDGKVSPQGDKTHRQAARQGRAEGDRHDLTLERPQQACKVARRDPTGLDRQSAPRPCDGAGQYLSSHEIGRAHQLPPDVKRRVQNGRS